jgi:MtN3 and saliva related transmembrane protein
VKATDAPLVGWAASAVLLATLFAQVRAQWRTRSVEGVSPLLFAGQLIASVGFLTYSALVGDLVFVATNTLTAVTAIVGQLIDRRNRRMADPPCAQASSAGATPSRAR